MKLNKILRYLIIFLVSIILIFGIFLSSAVKNYGFDFVQITKYYLFQSPVETVKDIVTTFNEMNHLTNQVNQYKIDAQKSKYYYNENIELKKQITELSSLLKMQDTNQQFKYEAATIINRTPNEFNDRITINIGENKGIQVGHVVVGNAGILGKIIHVTKNTATVSLITSAKSLHQFAVAVLLDEINSVFGIVQGYDLKENALELRILESDKEIKAGLPVITSGVGKLYPAGITLGKVKKTKKLENDLGQLLLVEIDQKLDDLRYVSVIVGSK